MDKPENTEGIMKNGQTGNIGHTWRMQAKNTTQYVLDIIIHKQTHIP